MPLRITCPSCQTSLIVAENKRGKKIFCRACEKPMFIPDAPDHEIDERIMERGGRAAPVKAPLPPSRSRADTDDYGDEPRERSSRKKRKKQSNQMPLIIGASVGGVVLLLGLVLLLVLGSGSEPNQTDAAPVAQAAPPGQPPVQAVAPLPNQPQPRPAPGQPVANAEGGGGLKGEVLYQNLLKSTVWILATQPNRATAFAQPFPQLPQPPRPPFSKLPRPRPPIPGQGGGIGSNLDFSTWMGNEQLAGYGRLQFQFGGPGSVTMIDAKETRQGRYVQNGGQLVMEFNGVVYTGQLNGNAMSGIARDQDQRTGRTRSWSWSVTRQGGGMNPQPQPQPNPPRPPTGGQLVSSGTGSLIDRQHRLVLTNVHVVGQADKVVVHFPVESNGNVETRRDVYNTRPGILGRVVAREERCDLALIKLDSLPGDALVLPFAAASAKPGQQVHSIGNPGVSGALWNYNTGKVRQVFHDNWQILDEQTNKLHNYQGMKLETSSPLNPGDSGGPLVNDRNSLVGVAHGGNFRAQNLSIFIDVSECRALVQKYFQSIGQTWVPEREKNN